MAAKDEDTIDFDKLELELNAAVEADSRYWRENDAKFRAIHQKVGSYEEFRDIVLASHIKPLEKGDKIGEKFNQPWNVAADKSQGGDLYNKEASEIKQDTKLPKTNQEFIRDWRRYCKTAEERYNFLKRIGSENLQKIFKIEFGFGILGDIFSSLYEYEDTDVQFCLEVLQVLTKAQRFGLSIDFLGDDEKETCLKMFEKLRKKDNQTDEQMTLIAELEKLYEIS